MVIRSSPKSKVPEKKHIFNYEEDKFIKRFYIYKIIPSKSVRSQIRTRPIVYAREID